MANNEIKRLESEIAKLKRTLKRRKKESIQVLLSPTSEFDKAAIFELNHFISSYFEHLVYDYDLDEAKLTIRAPAYDVWPVLQLAVKSQTLRNESVKAAVQSLVSSIVNGTSTSSQYVL